MLAKFRLLLVCLFSVSAFLALPAGQGSGQHTAHAATITAKQDGKWDDPATWDVGAVPTAADDVTIPAGLTIEAAPEAPLSYKSCELLGALISKGNATLAGNFNVRPSGDLWVGAELHFNVENDRTFIGGESDASRADIGLWIEGRCTIEGEYKTPWVELLIGGPMPSTGNTYGVTRSSCVKLASEPVNWKPTDQYLCISPDGSVLPCKYGEWNGVALSFRDKTILPRVVNLTRTAGVSSSPGNYKAHVIVMHNGHLVAKNAYFKDLGPAGIKGRYPIHLHRATCTCPDGRGASSITDCSIYSTDPNSPSNRGIAIHDTFGHLVQGNTFVNVLGHAIFFEQPSGKEWDNQVIGNTTINVRGGQRTLDLGSGPKLQDGVEVVSNDEEKIYPWTSHIWGRPGNTFRDNVCVGGGGSALGMVVMPGKGGTETTIEGQQCWGVGDWGIQNAGPATWKNPVVVGAGVAGYASIARWIDRGDGKPVSDAGTKLADPVLLLSGGKTTDKNVSYKAQIFANSSPDLSVDGGSIAGEVASAVHYISNLKINNAVIKAKRLCSLTYGESNVVISGGEIEMVEISDRFYPMSKAVHGSLRLITTLNGKGVDKTVVGKAIAAQAGLPLLSDFSVTYSNGVKEVVAVEVPNQAVGSVILPVKAVRLWQKGQPVPTTWPLAVSTFGGLFPGTYQAVGWKSTTVTGADGKLLPPDWMGEFTVKAGEVTEVK